MAIDLLTGENRPPVGAYVAEPFSLSEIDTHPESDRIWATIMRMRETHQNAFDEWESEEIADLTEDWEAERKAHGDELEALREELEDAHASEIDELKAEIEDLEFDQILYQGAA